MGGKLRWLAPVAGWSKSRLVQVVRPNQHLGHSTTSILAQAFQSTKNLIAQASSSQLTVNHPTEKTFFWSSMHCLGWITTYLLIGVSLQKSISRLDNLEEKDSLEFLDENKDLTSKKRELLEEKEENNLEEQYSLVSMLLDQVILNTLMKTNNLLESNTKEARKKLRAEETGNQVSESELNEFLLVGRRPRRGRRHRGGGRGRGDLIPYPRVG